MSSPVALSDVVPTIDFSAFAAGGPGKAAVASAIRAACERVGFLILGGHGLPQALVDQAFAAGRAFYDQPEEVKRRAAPPSPLVPRGYHAHASKTLARTLGVETPPDLRAQFYMGPVTDHAAHFAGLPGAAEYYRPNIWPETPAEFGPALRALYQRLEGLAATVMRSFAVGLGLEEGYFDARFARHFSTCALNHYPPPQGDALPGQLRAGAHTDFGSLTLLLLDDAPGGLQVQTVDGAWGDVRPRRGEIVVNIGDMMARWTNDRWRSTLHRVVNPPATLAARSRRQTISFFYNPDFDTPIACLPTCLGPGESPRYPPIGAGDLMRIKMERRIG